MAYKAIPASASSGTGGTADLNSAIYSFAVSQYPTINKYYYSEVRGPLTDYVATGGGGSAGTSTASQAFKGGVTQLATNAAGAGFVIVSPGLDTLTNSSVIATNMKTDVPWFMSTTVEIVAGVDASIIAAAALMTNTVSALIYFGFIGSISTTNWSLSINSLTTLDSGVAITTGSFVLLMLGFDGTTIKAWTSTPAGILTTTPTLVASQTTLTNVPTGVGVPVAFLQSTGAATQRFMRVDHVFGAFKGATT